MPDTSTENYLTTAENLQALIDRWGKGNVIKHLKTNHKQVQGVLDGTKKRLTQKFIDKIDNFYLETFEVEQVLDKAILVADEDINKSSDEIFKKYIKKAEDKINNFYAKEGFQQKIIKLQKRIDRLWTVIFTLCMLLIICSGLIISLAR
ncbi:MAG: hypothetical protein ACO3UU_05390 [Minisyncoccia bacterium]